MAIDEKMIKRFLFTFLLVNEKSPTKMLNNNTQNPKSNLLHFWVIFFIFLCVHYIILYLVDCPPPRGNMSIYATLNSTKPIPMAIRDSTVRFQTFGQRDNYDAPINPAAYYKKNRRKSSSPPDRINLGKNTVGINVHKLKFSSRIIITITTVLSFFVIINSV